MIRAEYDLVSSEETNVFLEQSNAALTDFIFTATNREFENTGTIMGYISNGKRIDGQNVNVFQDKIIELNRLLLNIDNRNWFGRLAMRKSVANLQRAITFPAEATPVYRANRRWLMKVGGQQLTNYTEAFWSIQIVQDKLVCPDDTPTSLVEVPNTQSTNYLFYEVYLDDTDQVRTTHKELSETDNLGFNAFYPTADMNTLTPIELHERLAFAAYNLSNS